MTLSQPTTLKQWQPQSIAELQQLVHDEPGIWVRGGGTKPALSAVANVSLCGLSGLIDYQPQEFTFTALAGTALKELATTLAAKGQFLPFDPILIEAGSTLGGAIASGLSGPGRFRYGGIRDFILGVRIITGAGDLVRGGGKVVKNAAGFDIPKLMVGSLGTLGIIVEATFKVFPMPMATATLCVDYASAAEALNDYDRLGRMPLDLLCLDYQPPARLWLRLGGLPDALMARVERCGRSVQGRVELVEDDRLLWRDVRELAFFPPACGVARVATTPREIPQWEAFADRAGLRPRRYMAGGHALWIGLPDTNSWQVLEGQLRHRQQGAVVVRGPGSRPLLGEQPGGAFAERLRRVLDPMSKFRPMLAPEMTP